MEKPKKKSGGCLRSLLALVIVLILMCPVSFILFYHDAPPVPGIDEIYDNVKWELSSGSGMGLQEGYYLWQITNLNDFAWPQAYIEFGETHLGPIGRVEPGEQAPFSNVLLVNLETSETEPLPIPAGGALKVRLIVDFSGEDNFISRIRETLGITQERYTIGQVSR